MQEFIAQYWPQLISVAGTAAVMLLGIPKLQEWFGWFSGKFAEKFAMITELVAMIDEFIDEAEEAIADDGKLDEDEVKILVAKLRAILDFAKTII